MKMQNAKCKMQNEGAGERGREERESGGARRAENARGNFLKEVPPNPFKNFQKIWIGAGGSVAKILTPRKTSPTATRKCKMQNGGAGTRNTRPLPSPCGAIRKRMRGTAIAVDEESHIQKPSGCEFLLIGKEKN